eukprot:79259_1
MEGSCIVSRSISNELIAIGNIYNNTSVKSFVNISLTNINEFIWNEIKPNLNIGRYYSGCAITQDEKYIFVFGGIDNNGTYLDSIEYLNIEKNNEWILLDNIKLHRPRAKAKVTVDFYNNVMFIIGGIDNNNNNDSPLLWIEKFDISAMNIVDAPGIWLEEGVTDFGVVNYHGYMDGNETFDLSIIFGGIRENGLKTNIIQFIEQDPFDGIIPTIAETIYPKQSDLNNGGYRGNGIYDPYGRYTATAVIYVSYNAEIHPSQIFDSRIYSCNQCFEWYTGIQQINNENGNIYYNNEIKLNDIEYKDYIHMHNKYIMIEDNDNIAYKIESTIVIDALRNKYGGYCLNDNIPSQFDWIFKEGLINGLWLKVIDFEHRDKYIETNVINFTFNRIPYNGTCVLNEYNQYYFDVFNIECEEFKDEPIIYKIWNENMNNYYLDVHAAN